MVTAAFLMALVLPSMAAAGPYIPPGNSAANQYTETFPSAGGQVEVNSSIGGGSKQSPKKALGDHTAAVLESQGPEGEAVAELATEAATPPAEATPPSPHKKAADHSAKKGRGHGTKQKEQGHGAGAGSRGTGPGSGSGATADHHGSGGRLSPGDGSSGLGQVASEATFSSSGVAGIFLPLTLLAALAWAVVYVVRRRGPDRREA